jgi:hypothetical protein
MRIFPGPPLLPEGTGDLPLSVIRQRSTGTVSYQVDLYLAVEMQMTCQQGPDLNTDAQRFIKHPPEAGLQGFIGFDLTVYGAIWFGFLKCSIR